MGEMADDLIDSMWDIYWEEGNFFGESEENPSDIIPFVYCNTCQELCDFVWFQDRWQLANRDGSLHRCECASFEIDFSGIEHFPAI